jgi:hypothetical protein
MYFRDNIKGAVGVGAEGRLKDIEGSIGEFRRRG